MAACSTPESATNIEPPVQEPVVEETSWFETAQRVELDGDTFSGYAVATAATSEQALEKAVELADTNLRFAIDRYAETVRRELAEADAAYQSRSFIMSLREAVRTLDLSRAKQHNEEMTNDHNASVAHVKRTLPKQEVAELLSGTISDQNFLESMTAAR
ncbi:MAG: hypothetical protein ACNA78_03260 [Balneolaceae bacterium]